MCFHLKHSPSKVSFFSVKNQMTTNFLRHKDDEEWLHQLRRHVKSEFNTNDAVEALKEEDM